MFLQIHKKLFPSILILSLLHSCLMPVTNNDDNILLTYEMDTVGALNAAMMTAPVVKNSPGFDSSLAGKDILTHNTHFSAWGKSYPSAELVSFSKTLLGRPYLYGSTDPAQGFDCSGFITYVFNHFGFKVPRSSVEFTNRGKEIPVQQAQPGDLILFTGTDSTKHIVGHMGIVIEPDTEGSLQFIHSSSGKANGVTISPLKGYYESRFMKVITVREGI